MISEKLVKKNERLLVEQGKEDSPAAQYPLTDTTVYLKLYSLQLITQASVSIVPPKMPSDDNTHDEKADSKEDDEWAFLFDDDKDEETVDARIEAIGVLDDDTIHVADREEEDTKAHKKIIISFRPIPKIDSKSSELPEQQIPYEFIRHRSCIFHLCDEALKYGDRNDDYLAADIYLLDDTYNALKLAISHKRESQVTGVNVGLRVRVFWSEMDQSLREPWMQRDLVILRSSRNSAILTNLAIEHEKVIGPNRDDDPQDDWDEEEIPQISSSSEGTKYSPLVAPKDVKHIITALRWIAGAVIISTLALLFS